MSPRPAAAARARSGITLTEILISILIMGVGLISIATLFPLGMVRLRSASQQTRSGFLAESATADLGVGNMLFKPSFQVPWYGSHDPFTSDFNPVTKTTTFTSSATGTGLPICYDPLWRSVTGVAPPAFGVLAAATQAEARFGCGVFVSPGNSFLRPDPDGSPASGYGLQRITNFLSPGTIPNAAATSGFTWPYIDPSTMCVSPDDPVMQNSDAPPQVIGGTNQTLSGVVPMVFNNAGGTVGFTSDWRYSWLFTGFQVDATNATVFVGNVVVMDSRPFGFESVNSPTSGTASTTASGEVVLEAVFGYSTTVSGGYGVAADRNVLLRWPTTMPDPEIKVGSWIADVTYERNSGTSNARVASAAGASAIYPMQRCHWYQVTKKTDVGPAAAFTGDPGAYRQMTVTTNTPVKARTLLSGGQPVHVNVALFMPSVVNAFQRTIFVRTDR